MQVWRTSTRSGGDRPVHVKPDCHRLTNAGEVRGPVDRSVYPDAALCEWCHGDAATKGNEESSREHLMALKEAAEGD